MCSVGSHLSGELVTRSDEFYRACECLDLCDLETSEKRWPVSDLGLWATTKELLLVFNWQLVDQYLEQRV